MFEGSNLQLSPVAGWRRETATPIKTSHVALFGLPRPRLIARRVGAASCAIVVALLGLRSASLPAGRPEADARKPINQADAFGVSLEGSSGGRYVSPASAGIGTSRLGSRLDWLAEALELSRAA